MAKQLVGPVERHIEKIIVGVAGLFLIGVLALYLVSSPNKVEFPGASELVTPSTVDPLLASKANQVREQLRTGRGEVETPAPLAETFAATLDPFKKENLGVAFTRGAALQPAVPVIDPPSVIEGSARLVEILPMPKPTVYFGRGTLDTGAEVEAANWVTVASRMEVKKQREMQSLAYGETRKDLVYGSVDLQRRVQRPDGSWSDDDWEDVSPWPAYEMPEPPVLTLEGEGKKVAVPKEQADELQRFRDIIQDPGRQQTILRPLFASVINGDRWSVPKISTYRELMVFDDEIRSPQFESETLEDRYGLAVEEPVAAQAEGNDTESILRNAAKRLALASTDAECVEIFNKMHEIINSPGAGAAEKTRARKIQEEADQKQRDLKRFGTRDTGGKPTQKQRTASAQQVVWAHDAAPGSVPSGQTVQYRIRMTLLNVLAGEPLLFRNKEDATQVFISGPWSEPSDPIDVPATERFFITSCDEKREEIKVEMYRWFDGVWVKNRGEFTIGQPMRMTKRTEAPRQDDPTQVDRPEIEFAADATVVDINFNRGIRERKTAGKTGVRFAAPTSDCAVVLVDSKGRLDERFVSKEKASPDKRTVDQMVWKPARP